MKILHQPHRSRRPFHPSTRQQHLRQPRISHFAPIPAPL